MKQGGALTSETARKGLRLLGAKFFNELQQNTMGKKMKTYDCNRIEEEDETHLTEDADGMELDEVCGIPVLPDFAGQFCNDFEEQIVLTCQESSELASCFTTYQEARSPPEGVDSGPSSGPLPDRARTKLVEKGNSRFASHQEEEPC